MQRGDIYQACGNTGTYIGTTPTGVLWVCWSNSPEEIEQMSTAFDRLYNTGGDPTMEQLARFAELVRQHDLTYQYSDDYSVWLAGQQSYNAIVAMKRALGPTHAVACKAIWNAEVQRKMRPEAWAQWCWK